MDKLIKIGPVIVLLRDFPIYTQWPFWQWKLDPFCVNEGEADLVVEFKRGAVAPEGVPLTEECSVYAHNCTYRLSDGGVLWQQTYQGQIMLQYKMDGEGKTITLTEDNTNTCGVAAFEGLTFLIFYAALNKNVLTLHGSLVECEGRGIVFSAFSGGGKTTQARLWRDSKNAFVINGDKAALFKNDGVWSGFGSPWCGTSGECMNRQVQIFALVMVKKAESNSLRSLSGMELLSAVMPQASIPSYSPRLAERAASLLDGFLAEVKVYELSCTPDVRAVDLLYGEIFG